MLADIESERQVIGGIIQAPEAVYPGCLELGITDDYFFDTTCKTLWTEIDNLNDYREAKRLDEILARSDKNGSSQLAGEACNMRLSCINARLSVESAEKVSDLYAQRGAAGVPLTKTQETSLISRDSFIGRLESMIASTPENLKAMRARAKDAVFILPKIALAGDLTILNAQYNTGKTLLTLWLLSQRDQARTEGYTFYYINADDSYNGGIEKADFVESIGVHSLIPNQRGFSADKLEWILESAIEASTAGEMVIILDTLKKFVDMMDKSNSRKLNLLLRQFTQAGGTLIALAHTNKNKGSDGQSVAEGVGDFLNDFDCAYIIEEVEASPPDSKIVVFKNNKLRGPNAQEVTFTYDSGEGKSWKDRFDSIRQLDGGEAKTAVATIEADKRHEKDLPVIRYIEQRLSSGEVSKRELLQSDLGEGRPSKAQREQVLDAYSVVNDRAEHRHWMVKTGTTGGKVYYLPDMIAEV